MGLSTLSSILILMVSFISAQVTTPFPSDGSSSGSGNGGLQPGPDLGSTVCSDGSLRPGSTFFRQVGIGADGRVQYELTAVVEACSNGVYGGVCDRGIGADEAESACMNFGSLFNTTLSLIGSEPLFGYYSNYTSPVVIQDVNCTGYEVNGCQFSSIIDSDCSNSSRAVGVRCYYADFNTVSNCISGELRTVDLTYGSSPNSTEYYFTLLVEMCVNNMYGGICERDIGTTEAVVACRSIGQTIGIFNVHGGEPLFGQYPSYTGQIVVQDVNCTGVEYSITECSASLDIDAYCNQSSRAIGVRCYYGVTTPFPTPFPSNGSSSGSGNEGLQPVDPNCTDGQLRTLQEEYQYIPGLDGSSRIVVTALVEGCIGGTFGGICDVNFSNASALVFCNNIDFVYGYGFASRAEAVMTSHNYTSQIVVQDVSCVGNETLVIQCPINTVISPTCMDPDRAVVIRCYYNIPTERGSGSTSGSERGSGDVWDWCFASELD